MTSELHQFWKSFLKMTLDKSRRDKIEILGCNDKFMKVQPLNCLSSQYFKWAKQIFSVLYERWSLPPNTPPSSYYFLFILKILYTFSLLFFISKILYIFLLFSIIFLFLSTLMEYSHTFSLSSTIILFLFAYGASTVT